MLRVCLTCAVLGRSEACGLTCALVCSCGLELDFGTMRRFKHPAMRLALLPGLVRVQLSLGSSAGCDTVACLG